MADLEHKLKKIGERLENETGELTRRITELSKENTAKQDELNITSAKVGGQPIYTDRTLTRGRVAAISCGNLSQIFYLAHFTATQRFNVTLCLN